MVLLPLQLNTFQSELWGSGEAMHISVVDDWYQRARIVADSKSVIGTIRFSVRVLCSPQRNYLFTVL